MAKQKKIDILIMGRPNVGKSTLLNRLIKRKKTITEDTPGVTRDIISYDMDYQGHTLTLIDSGGVYFEKKKEKSPFQDEIENKVTQTLQTVTKIWMIVDGKEGLHPLDQHIAKIIRKHKNITLVVNKVDQIEKKAVHAQFYQLGLGDPFCVSATQGQGLQALLDEMIKDLPKKEIIETQIEETTVIQEKPIKLSIVGRPNVGKSSLINKIIDQDRLIVSEQAGTTRDIVEIPFHWNKKSFILLDTAGLKKSYKNDQGADYYAAIRSMKAIKETDVVMVLLSAEDPLSRQDKRIIKQAVDANKPLLIFINKWDLMDTENQYAKKDMKQIVISNFTPLENNPILIGSTKDKVGINTLFENCIAVYEASKRRIATGDLNRFVNRIIQKNPPRGKSSKRQLKIYYATQAEIAPPHFIFFINHVEKISKTYERYVEKQIREYLDPFFGTPIKITFKPHREKKEKK